MVRTREQAIRQLYKIADHLHSLNTDENISKVVGASTGVLGGLAIVGSSIATVATGGIAAPLLVAAIAGTTASVAGAGVGIGAAAICSKMSENDFQRGRAILNQDLVNSRRVSELLNMVNDDYAQNDCEIKIDAKSFGINLGASITTGAVSVGAVASRAAALSKVAGMSQGAVRTVNTLVKASTILGWVGIATALPAIGLDVYHIVKSAKSLYDGLPTEAESQIRAAATAMEGLLEGSRESIQALQAYYDAVTGN